MKRWDHFVIGYRYQQLDDRLRIREATESLDASFGVPSGTTLDLLDRFDTENRFHGG